MESAPEKAAPEPGAAADGSVVGQVADALGDPIAGADVWIVSGPDETERARSRTASDGSFRLENLPLEGMQVRATAPRRYVGMDHVSLGPEQHAGTAYIRLWDTGSVRGRVLDAHEEPVQGATVIASSNGSRVLPFESLAEATSGAEGRFELARVPLGSVWIRAVAPGRGIGAEMVRLQDTADVVVRLAGEGVDVSVQVNGIDDPSTTRVRVRLLPYDGGSIQILPSSLVRGSVDAKGAWLATGLPDFDYTIYVSADGFSFKPQQHAVKRGRKRHEVSFQAFRDGASTLRGVLHDDAGNPLPGETIQCRATNGLNPGTAVTSGDGSFAIPVKAAPGTECFVSLVASRYVLSRKKEPGRPGAPDSRVRGRVEMTLDPESPLDLCAIPIARVSGKVLTKSGSPVPHARITLQHANSNRDPRWWMDFAYGQTRADGRFEFTNLHAVEDEIRANVATREGAASSETFKIERGRAVDDVTVVLAPSAVIEGTVRNQNGQPVAGARVWVMNWDLEAKRQRDGGVAETLTDSHGRYRHVGVDPGGHWLECFMDRSGRRVNAEREKFDVPPGARLERDLVLQEN